MSYILDALRKADAERTRGSVPGLHAQPAAGADGAEAAPRRRPLRGLALAALAGLLAALGWWAGRESAPSPVPVPAPSPVALAPAATQAPVATASVPSLPASQPPATPPLQLPTSPSVADATPARSVITLPASPPVPVPMPSASAAVAAVAPGAATSAPPPAASRLPLLGDMPADLRRQLPALTMGGSVYSDRPASRFVMINGQLLREGDTVAPGLVLESLRPKSAVLVFRGQRFEWPY